MTLWLAAAVLVCACASWALLPRSRSRNRFRGALIYLALWLVLWLVPNQSAQTAALALLEIAALQVIAGVVFEVALAQAGIPRFAIEMGVVAGYLVVFFKLLVNIGVNVTGIFATSAVATAVLGLSLQDLLGNIAGGVALQLERGIRTGDFIRCGEQAGWVQHVRLRSTVILTADGDSVVLPNSFLTRSSVVVMAPSRRLFVPFSMPYAQNPQELMDAVTAALGASTIPGISLEPTPRCVIREMATGHIQYAAVVWIAQPGHETAAISSVLNRIYFALERAGCPATEITHLLEMREAKKDALVAARNPAEILRTTPIFRLLDDAALAELGGRLHRLSFAPGERILRQGDDGDSMYFVTAGEVTISFAGQDRVERKVAVLGPGDFFGEISLLTGEARNANAVALGRVVCYQLGKTGLQGIIEKRPDLAEDMSTVMSHRHMELSMVRDAWDEETARLLAAENQRQLLSRIRRFFGMDTRAPAPAGAAALV